MNQIIEMPKVFNVELCKIIKENVHIRVLFKKSIKKALKKILKEIKNTISVFNIPLI